MKNIVFIALIILSVSWRAIANESKSARKPSSQLSLNCVGGAERLQLKASLSIESDEKALFDKISFRTKAGKSSLKIFPAVGLSNEVIQDQPDQFIATGELGNGSVKLADLQVDDGGVITISVDGGVKTLSDRKPFQMDLGWKTFNANAKLSESNLFARLTCETK